MSPFVRRLRLWIWSETGVQDFDRLSEPHMPRQPAKDELRASANHPGVGLLSAAEWRRLANHFRLTEHEMQVARWVFEGQSRPQIAAALDCALGTVRVYIDRVFDKLAVADKHQMTLRIMQVHLANCHC
jgi:DNA-binding NarL/FixJ family response regulator